PTPTLASLPASRHEHRVPVRKMNTFFTQSNTFCIHSGSTSRLSGSAIQSLEKCRNFWFNLREIMDDHIPDNGIIDPEIAVNDPVAKCCHLPPRYFRAFFFDLVGYIFCCFPDYFDRPPDRMSKIVIIDELVKSPVVRYPFQEKDLVKDVAEVDRVILQPRSPQPRLPGGYTCQPPRP